MLHSIRMKMHKKVWKRIVNILVVDMLNYFSDQIQMVCLTIDGVMLVVVAAVATVVAEAAAMVADAVMGDVVMADMVADDIKIANRRK